MSQRETRIHYEIPMSDGTMAELLVTKHLAVEDAERLAALIRTLVMEPAARPVSETEQT